MDLKPVLDTSSPRRVAYNTAQSPVKRVAYNRNYKINHIKANPAPFDAESPQKSYQDQFMPYQSRGEEYSEPPGSPSENNSEEDLRLDEQIENYYSGQMHNQNSAPEVSPVEERLGNNYQSGDPPNDQSSPKFVFDDSALKKYATEGFKENSNSRNIDIETKEKEEPDEQQYLYKHQPNFSRVSERSQEEDEESFDLKKTKMIKKSGLVKRKSSNLRDSSVSKSCNLSDNSQVGKK